MDKKVLIGIGVVVAVIVALPLVSKLQGASPAASAPGSATASSPRALAEDLVKALSRGDAAGAYAKFDDKMKAAMPTGKLTETWTALQGQMGAFKQEHVNRSEKAQGHDVVFVTCEFERGTVDLQVAVSPASQVAGLYIVPTK
jgi:hypothetical protein